MLSLQREYRYNAYTQVIKEKIIELTLDSRRCQSHRKSIENQ